MGIMGNWEGKRAGWGRRSWEERRRGGRRNRTRGIWERGKGEVEGYGELEPRGNTEWGKSSRGNADENERGGERENAISHPELVLLKSTRKMQHPVSKRLQCVRSKPLPDARNLSIEETAADVIQFIAHSDFSSKRLYRHMYVYSKAYNL